VRAQVEFFFLSSIECGLFRLHLRLFEVLGLLSFDNILDPGLNHQTNVEIHVKFDRLCS